LLVLSPITQGRRYVAISPACADVSTEMLLEQVCDALAAMGLGPSELAQQKVL
jgi:hypothetical protein